MYDYIAIHNHEYGFRMYRFQSSIDNLGTLVMFNAGDNDCAEALADHLGINFEPHLGEGLTIIMDVLSIYTVEGVFNI
jgi:hypothetical protein